MYIRCVCRPHDASEILFSINLNCWLLAACAWIHTCIYKCVCWYAGVPFRQIDLCNDNVHRQHCESVHREPKNSSFIIIRTLNLPFALRRYRAHRFTYLFNILLSSFVSFFFNSSSFFACLPACLLFMFITFSFRFFHCNALAFAIAHTQKHTRPQTHVPILSRFQVYNAIVIIMK